MRCVSRLKEERLRRAIEAGQLISQVEPLRVLDLLMGTIAMPLLFNQPLPEDGEADAIVDQLLMGLTPDLPDRFSPDFAEPRGQPA